MSGARVAPLPPPARSRSLLLPPCGLGGVGPLSSRLWVWVPFPPACGLGSPLVDEEAVAARPRTHRPAPKHGDHTTGGRGGGGCRAPGP